MNILFSFIIPAYNEEKNIGKLLSRIKKYLVNYTTEIIVINSGSTDNTAQIVKRFQKGISNLKLIEIEKSDFNHGTTRNLGVKFARGQYICFLSADALIMNEKFLHYFLEDFRANPKVVAVFGKQIPYTNTPIIQKIENISRFERLEKHVDKTGRIFFQLSKPFIPYDNKHKLLWYFLFDTFSCYKKSFLIKNPFQRTVTLEDFLIGKKILEKGFIKVYDNRCLIRHSHIMSISEYYKQEKDHLYIRSKLINIKNEINFISKIQLISKMKVDIFKKISYIFQLFFYYFLKFIILIELRVKYSFEKLLVYM